MKLLLFLLLKGMEWMTAGMQCTIAWAHQQKWIVANFAKKFRLECVNIIFNSVQHQFVQLLVREPGQCSIHLQQNNHQCNKLITSVTFRINNDL